MKVSLLDYLCILNIVIYGEREIFPEELKKEIKDEIRNGVNGDTILKIMVFLLITSI